MAKYWIIFLLVCACVLWANGQEADESGPTVPPNYKHLLEKQNLKLYTEEFPAFSIIEDPISSTFRYGYPIGYTVNEACPAGGLNIGNSFLPWHGVVHKVYTDCIKETVKGHGKLAKGTEALVRKCFRETLVRKHQSYAQFAENHPDFKYANELLKLKAISKDEMALCANYVYCTSVKQHKRYNRGVVCPDPCKKDQCSVRDNALPGTCFSDAETRMFKNDFSCNCDDGFQWDPATRQCLPIDLCASPKWNPCNRENTQTCQTKSGAVLCTCKTGFGGVTCQVKLA